MKNTIKILSILLLLPYAAMHSMQPAQSPAAPLVTAAAAAKSMDLKTQADAKKTEAAQLRDQAKRLSNEEKELLKQAAAAEQNEKADAEKKAKADADAKAKSPASAQAAAQAPKADEQGWASRIIWGPKEKWAKKGEKK